MIDKTINKNYNFGHFYLSKASNHCKNGNPSFHGVLYPAGKNHIISFSLETFFFLEMEKWSLAFFLVHATTHLYESYHRASKSNSRQLVL